VIEKTKVKIKKRKPLKKRCDELLRKLCLLKAKNCSELSGKNGVLQIHHIAGKPNYYMRYLLENCIVLTAGEHNFGIHNPNREEEYREKIKAVRGQDIYERLEQYKHSNMKTDLTLVEIYLKNEINKLKGTDHK